MQRFYTPGLAQCQRNGVLFRTTHRDLCQLEELPLRKIPLHGQLGERVVYANLEL